MLVLNAHGRKKVTHLAFSPDGRLLASSGLDGYVRLWSPTSNRAVRKLRAASEFGIPLALAFSPNGRYLVIGGRDGFQVCRPPDGEVREFHHGEPLRLAFVPSGQYVIALQLWSVVRWAIPSGRESPRWRWGNELRIGVRPNMGPDEGLAVSPDGKTLAVSFSEFIGKDESAWVALADAGTGKVKSRLPAPPTPEYESDQLAFSPDGRQLARACGKSLYVWDVKARRKPPVRRTAAGLLRDLAFTPDGRRLVTVGKDQAVRLWDTAAWTETGAYAWKVGPLQSVAVSPDGLRMAAGSDTGKVVVWDADG